MTYDDLLASIADSYLKHFDRRLPLLDSTRDRADQIEKLPYPVLSHTNQADPIFNYGNQKTLEIFEYSLQEFLTLPSRLSAEPGRREERQRVMEEVKLRGFTDNYRGVRITKSGKRFEITKASIWNLHGEAGQYIGQAAALFEWRFLS